MKRLALIALLSATCAFAQDAPPRPPQDIPQLHPEDPSPAPQNAPGPPNSGAPQERDVQNAPGLQQAPNADNPNASPDAPLPQSDRTSMDLRKIAPMATQPPSPTAPTQSIQHAEETHARPTAESPHYPGMRLLNLIGPYRRSHVGDVPAGTTDGIASMVQDGRLYLSLHGAIMLGIENNLDVEISRYNLLLADTDLLRAKGGGTLRGLDLTINQGPPGVGETSAPLLVTTTTTGSNSPTNAQVIDLSQVETAGQTTQQNLSANGNTSTFSQGPAIPLFDPTLIGQAGYFRRSDSQQLISTAGATTATPTANSNAPLNYVSAGIDYQEGFSTGTQIEVYGDNASQALYASNSQYNPLHAPSTSATVTQPLLRGFGRGINLRFVHIARFNQQISQLVFVQQVLEVVYGVSRLYYDLVSLGENVGVKEQSLAAAQRLYEDDKSQVELGTLSPVELTRAQALLSASRLDLVQARDQYRQQEAILRQQLLRRDGDPAAVFTAIVPTDKIIVPDDAPTLDVPALIQEALANRPDLAQAGLQIKANEVALKGSRNAVLPQLNVFANVQTRGTSLTPYTLLGSPGTGMVVPPTALTTGGLRLSTIYQGGVQITLPLRNRIAQADAARDAIQSRQAEGRQLKMENEVRQEIENAAIALDNAHQAYAAAVESSNFQQQLLQAEIDKFGVGASTNFMIVQDQAYLAQARSTEVAARSDWMKARITLDRSLGNLLEKNAITLEGAIDGNVH